ncbi:MAG: DUF1700 domain-containing protein [Thermoclostridium sp.]|nr:DUF1700 domain-containing protein [Thermoclostridium sp.]
MNKTEFLAILDNSIGKVSDEVKREILYDYEEHFSVGLEKGKTEEEVSQSLGDPRQIARQFRAECALRHAEGSSSASNVFRAVFATMGLGFFNLIFVLAPFLAVAALILGLLLASMGILVGGLGLILAVVISPIFPELISIDFNLLVILFLGIGVTALGLLSNILMYYLIKGFFKVTTSYLKMNYNIITGRRKEHV